MVFFGFAFCGRLDTQYLPPRKEASFGSRTGSFSSNIASQGFSTHNSFSSHAANNGGFAGVPSNRAEPTFHANTPQVPILRFDNENNGDGSFRYAYETADGVQAQEQGVLRDDGQEGSQQSQGSFSFTAPDGNQYSISYIADENGFQPQGAHLPTPPPIPEEILKALEQNAADEARGIIDDGQYHGEGASGGNAVSGAYKQQSGIQHQEHHQLSGYQKHGNNGGYKY